MSLYHRMTFHWSSAVRCFVYNQPEFKFVHDSNYTDHYKSNCTDTHTHFSPCIFNWNTLFTGHTQRTVRFPQRKPLPRSSTNPTVTICELLWCKVLQVQHWFAMLVNKFLEYFSKIFRENSSFIKIGQE